MSFDFFFEVTETAKTIKNMFLSLTHLRQNDSFAAHDFHFLDDSVNLFSSIFGFEPLECHARKLGFQLRSSRIGYPCSNHKK